MIESQILGNSEGADDTDIIEESLLESLEDNDQEYDMTPGAAAELKEMLENNASELDIETSVPTSGDEESSIISSANYIKECNEYIDTVREVLGKVRGTKPAELNEQDLQKYLALVAISDRAVNKLSEMVASAEGMQIFEGVIQNSQDQIHNFKKEIREMKRSLRDLLSEEVITIELDLGEDAVVDSEDITVKVKEEEELIDADSDVEVDTEEVEEVEVEEEEEVELEEGEMDLMELVDELEEDEDEPDGLEEGLDDDTILEIDENMLREELAKLMQASAEVIKPSSKEEEALKETAETVATEQNDDLQAELASYQSAVADLKSQLAEMSLFNAKLLYTNKLLMNSDLSQAHRAQAIETLDDAASLREVKLLFKTLTESFSKRAETNPGSRNIGGSSRLTKSASMKLNESTEANRWALLAGIK